MAGYGLMFLGPSLHLWFNFVSKIFPKTDMVSTLKKMVMGQTIYGPCLTTIFLSLNALLQGTSYFQICFTCYTKASLVNAANY